MAPFRGPRSSCPSPSYSEVGASRLRQSGGLRGHQGRHCVAEIPAGVEINRQVVAAKAIETGDIERARAAFERVSANRSGMVMSEALQPTFNINPDKSRPGKPNRREPAPPTAPFNSYVPKLIWRQVNVSRDVSGSLPPNFLEADLWFLWRF